MSEARAIPRISSEKIKRAGQPLKPISAAVDKLQKLPPDSRAGKEINALLGRLRKIADNLVKTPPQEIREIRKEIESNKALLEDVLEQKKNGRITDLQEFKELKETLGQLEIINSELKEELTGRGLSPETRINKNLPLPIDNRRVREDLTKDQVLGKPIAGPEIPGSSLRTELVISDERILHAIERKETIESLVRSIIDEPREEPSSRIFELLARLLTSISARELMIEIKKSVERTGELSDEEIDRIVEKVNERLARSDAAAIARSESELRDIKEADKKISIRVEYSRDRHSIGIEIAGKIEKPEALRVAAGVARSSPKEAVPALIEAAARQIAGHPEAKAEITRSVSEMITQSFSTDPADPMSVQEPSPAAIQAVLGPLVRTLGADDAKAEIALIVLESLPNSTLPELVKEHDRLSSSGDSSDRQVAKKILGPMIADLAGKENPLVSSSIDRQAVIEAAKSLIEKARSFRSGAKTSSLPIASDKGGQFLKNTWRVVRANEALLAPDQLTAETAQAFIELVNKIQKCFDSIAVKTARITAYDPKKTPVTAQSIAQKAQKEGKIAERAKALRELLDSAKDNNFIIPTEIKDNIYAGLAGFKPIAVKADVPNLFASPQESASARLNRIVAELEAQATRAVRGTDPVSTAVISTFNAVVILKGIITQMVKRKSKKAGKIEDEVSLVFDELESRETLDEITGIIKEILDPSKQFHAIKQTILREYLNNLVLEVDLSEQKEALAAAA